jgi:ABC-2 type transport system permease protein
VRTLRLVSEVIRWEILRYIRIKQQIAGFVLTFAILMTISFASRLGGEPGTIEIAIIGADRLPTLAATTGRFAFRHHHPMEERRLRDAVENREFAALLLLRNDHEAHLVTRHSPGWRAELELELAYAARLHRIRTAGLAPAILERIHAPFQLDVVESVPRAGRAERVAAVIALALVLVGLFGGIGYIFSSVTGEKNNRLSEQVVSAIPAQVWIDGKILGLSFVSVVMIANTVLAIGLWTGARFLLWGDTVTLPGSLERPGLLAAALALILLGYFFWFTFLIAMAALVDDPHTSTRGQLLLLPALSAFPAFLAIPDPDATWARVLGILPPTSAAMMPVRVLVTEVAVWELATAVALLLALIVATRRIAGKIFRLAMLMYGKEPSWREVRRWIGEA